MTQHTHEEPDAVAPAESRSELGATWWLSLVVVPVVLGLLARDEGFWSVFLWCVVGFAVGTLFAYLVSGGVAGRGGRSDEGGAR